MKKHIFRASMLSLATAVVLGLTACSGGGGDSGTTTSDTSVSGVATDGYLQGATVTAGTQSVVTDANGVFTLAAAPQAGEKILISGGTDKSTGYPFEGRLSSVYEAGQKPIVTPLSTYVTALVDQNISLTDAKEQVAAALAIAEDELQKDPMSSPVAFLAAQKVQKTAEVLAAAIGSEDFNTNYEKVMTSLATVTQAGEDFNATKLAEQVADDHEVTIEPEVSEFLETYVATVDEFAEADVSVAVLDDVGEVLNTYTEVVEGALDTNDTTAIASYTDDLDSLDANETVTAIEDGNFTDPLVTALAEIENVLDNNISYLGNNTANDNIVENLVLTDPSSAPFDTDDLNLTWSANNSAVDVSTGEIHQAYTDTPVELKATVSNSLASNYRVFNLIIKREEIAPTVGDLNVTIDEDNPTGALDFSGVISDLNGDALTITAVGEASNGIATLTDGVVTYTPSQDFNGGDSFTYTVTDSTGLDANGTVHITVNPVNDAPVASSDTVTILEDTAVTVDVVANDTDVDGDTLTVTTASSEANATIDVSDGNITYTPILNFVGTDIVTYTVSDGNGGEANATLTITVNNVNDAPVASSDTVTILEDTAVTVDVVANDTDVDGDTLTVTTASSEANATIDVSDGNITYAPILNFVGTDIVTYTISDGNGGEANATLSITITAVNDAPVVPNNDLILSVKVDNTLSGQLEASDVDGDTLTFSDASVTAGDITLDSNGSFTYGAPDTNQTVTFTYNVSDGNVTVGGEQTITVVRSDPPVANDDNVTIDEDTTVSIDVLANDTDDLNATLTIISATASEGNVTIEDNATLTYVPNTNFNGIDIISYTIEDPDGGQSSADVNVTVISVNDEPEILNNTYSVQAGSITTLSILSDDRDADEDPLTIVDCDTADINGTVTVDESNTTLSYTADADFEGTDNFICQVTDGMVTVDENVTVNVSINHSPVAPSITLTMLVGDTITGQIQASDEDNDTLTYSIVTDLDGSLLDGSPYVDANVSEKGEYSVTATQAGKGEINIKISDGTNTVYAGYTIDVIYSQENLDAFEVSEGAALTSDAFDELANDTHDSIPADTKLYGAWGKNWDYSINALVFETDYIEFMSDDDHTFIISDDNETSYTHNNNLDDITTVSMVDENGTSISVVDAIMIDANMSADAIKAEIPTLANLELPAGSVVYKMAVRMKMEEYEVWGEAQDCTDGNCIAYDTLSDMVDENASGIIAYNEKNRNHLLVFAKDSNIADGNGTVVEVDMTDVYLYGSGEPIVINPEAGTWTFIANGYEDDEGNGNNMIEVTVNDISGYEKYPIILIEADAYIDGNNTESVYRGVHIPEGDASYEYRFNEVVYHTLQNYYAPVTVENWISNRENAEDSEVNATSFANMDSLALTGIAIFSPLYDFWIDKQYREQAHFEVWGMQFNSDDTLDINVTQDGVANPNLSEHLTYVINSDTSTSSDNNITIYREIDGTTTAVFALKVLDSMSGSDITDDINLSVSTDATVYQTAGLQLVDEAFYDDEENATAYAIDGTSYSGYTSVDAFITDVADNELGFAFSYDGNYTLTLDNSSDENSSGNVIEVNLDTNDTTTVGQWEVISVVSGTTREDTLVIDLDDNVTGYDEDMAFGMHDSNVLLRGNIDFAGEGEISYLMNQPMLDMLQANFTNQFITPFTYEELVYLTIYGVFDDSRDTYFITKYGSYFDHYRFIDFGTFEDYNIYSAPRQTYSIVDGNMEVFNDDGTFAYTIKRTLKNDMFCTITVTDENNESTDIVSFYNKEDAEAFRDGYLELEP